VTLIFDLAELKSNRGHVVTKTKQQVKYESHVINSSQDNKQITFLPLNKSDFVTLTYDLVDLKS